MRRLLILIPIMLVGCAPGRQAAITNSGRIASTAEGGTYVTGVGKIGPESAEVAWSPDGQTLAFALRDGVWLWPSGERLTGMSGPLAFSPDSRQLAGVKANQVTIQNLVAGGSKATTIAPSPLGLRWLADGRLMAFDDRQALVDGGPTVRLKSARILDAMPARDGTVTVLAMREEPKTRSDSFGGTLVRWRWDPTSGVFSIASSDKVADLFGVTTPRRIDLPHRYALAPDGSGFAMASCRVEARSARLARMKELASKTHPTRAERAELGRLLGTSKLSSVVERVDGKGGISTIWRGPARQDSGVTDLEWSCDGRWLAIARQDGTVRVRVE